jgi:hypothetical protein
MSQQITGVTGSFTPPNVIAKDAGGSVVMGEQRHTDIQTGALVQAENFGLGDANTALNAPDGIQNDHNGFQEVMSFASRWASNTGQTGLAALHQIRITIDAILQQTANIRSYNP